MLLLRSLGDGNFETLYEQEEQGFGGGIGSIVKCTLGWVLLPGLWAEA